MRTAQLLPCMVLTLVAASAVSATSWPDPAVNPFQTRIPPYPTEFQDYSQLFARILADRGLGRWFDESLLQRIQADSRIDRVHDRSPEPIDVVRVDLRNPDGSSRVRSKNGDFPLYVLRETPKGLVIASAGRLAESVRVCLAKTSPGSSLEFVCMAVGQITGESSAGSGFEVS